MLHIQSARVSNLTFADGRLLGPVAVHLAVGLVGADLLVAPGTLEDGLAGDLPVKNGHFDVRVGDVGELRTLWGQGRAGG